MVVSRRDILIGALALAGGGLSISKLAKPASAATLAAEPWAQKLVDAARSQIGVTIQYDPAYTRIAFPGGDVPRIKGVCTDVIIRAYRDGLGIDLQALVHADMRRAFKAYPNNWGLAAPDPNIDHRRVPNLRTFLARQGAEVQPGTPGSDYRAGDIVTQSLPGNKTHIVLVSDQMNVEETGPLAIHNIGWGARLEDVLSAFPVTGHYRFAG
ncbi:MAG: hypothetical protein RLZZ444_1368 [Pseudomonadota bacterium]|jgi:uncharacterized protein YijF (DUF1287 family)